MVWADRMGRGRLFQSAGAAAAKARSPLVLFLVGRGVRRNRSADLKALTGVYASSRSERYRGARPFKHLKANKSTLKYILNLIGSQCSEARTGVMCSRRLVLVRRRAAAF